MTENMRDREIRRGDIFYVNGTREQQELGTHANRPMVIISNNHLNYCLDSVIAVPLTSKEKAPMPNHVSIFTGLDATAICENIRTVYKDRLGDFMRHCTDDEMEELEKAILYSVGISGPRRSDQSPHMSDLEAEQKSEILRLKTELSVCERLYNGLLDRLTGAKGGQDSD